MTRSEMSAAYGKASKQAEAEGFKHPGGKGYWKALRVFAYDNGIALPGPRAEAARKAKRAEAERTRRASKKAQ